MSWIKALAGNAPAEEEDSYDESSDYSSEGEVEGEMAPAVIPKTPMQVLKENQTANDKKKQHASNKGGVKADSGKSRKQKPKSSDTKKKAPPKTKTATATRKTAKGTAKPKPKAKAAGKGKAKAKRASPKKHVAASSSSRGKKKMTPPSSKMDQMTRFEGVNLFELIPMPSAKEIAEFQSGAEGTSPISRASTQNLLYTADVVRGEIPRLSTSIRDLIDVILLRFATPALENMISHNRKTVGEVDVNYVAGIMSDE